MDFSDKACLADAKRISYATIRPHIVPIVKDAIKVVNAVCPSPSVSVSLPGKLTLSCSR